MKRPRDMLSSETIDYLGPTKIDDNIFLSKPVKSSTLNRHQLTKPKSPGTKKYSELKSENLTLCRL